MAKGQSRGPVTGISWTAGGADVVMDANIGDRIRQLNELDAVRYVQSQMSYPDGSHVDLTISPIMGFSLSYRAKQEGSEAQSRFHALKNTLAGIGGPGLKKRRPVRTGRFVAGAITLLATWSAGVLMQAMHHQLISLILFVVVVVAGALSIYPGADYWIAEPPILVLKHDQRRPLDRTALVLGILGIVVPSGVAVWHLLRQVSAVDWPRAGFTFPGYPGSEVRRRC